MTTSRYTDSSKLINFKNIDNSIQCYIIQTSQYTRLDRLAKQYYDDQTLYWIISAYNPDQIPGDSIFVQKQKTIKIPKNISDVLNTIYG